MVKSKYVTVITIIVIQTRTYLKNRYSDIEDNVIIANEAALYVNLSEK